MKQMVYKNQNKDRDILEHGNYMGYNFIEGSTIINDHHISYILLQRINEVLK